MVQEYTGIDFIDQLELPVFEYWGYVHDAIIWNCNQSENGKQYLENAYNFAQTEADREGLSQLLNTRVVK